VRQADAGTTATAQPAAATARQHAPVPCRAQGMRPCSQASSTQAARQANTQQGRRAGGREGGGLLTRPQLLAELLEVVEPQVLEVHRVVNGIKQRGGGPSHLQAVGIAGKGGAARRRAAHWRLARQMQGGRPAAPSTSPSAHLPLLQLVHAQGVPCKVAVAAIAAIALGCDGDVLAVRQARGGAAPLPFVAKGGARTLLWGQTPGCPQAGGHHDGTSARELCGGQGDGNA
jgi:hypothetical protein